MTDLDPCPFCETISDGSFRWSNEHAVAFADGFPLNTGHTLIVPRLHVADLFELTPEVRAGVWALLDVVHAELRDQIPADGFNVGVNVGEAAGQTVGHVHVHLIPRCLGDNADPRGGVRWVVPARAAYWTAYWTANRTEG